MHISDQVHFLAVKCEKSVQMNAVKMALLFTPDPP